MLATIPMKRLGYDSPPAELPDLPRSARERGQIWSDAVFQAVLALKKQLTHSDAAIAAAAANSILELERTRMRHSTLLAGSEDVSEAQLAFEEEEREDRESAKRRRAEVGAEPRTEEPAPIRTDERAFAEHVREVAKSFETSGQAMPGKPEGFVSGLLKQWGIAAGAIPKGGFGKHLRIHGVGAAVAA